MEPNEWRVTYGTHGALGHTHSYAAAMRTARDMRINGTQNVQLEGRMVTPWREVEIPEAEEVT